MNPTFIIYAISIVFFIISIVFLALQDKKTANKRNPTYIYIGMASGVIAILIMLIFVIVSFVNSFQ